MSDRREVLERVRMPALETVRGADEDLRLPAVVPHFPIEPLVPQSRQQTRAVGERITRPDSRMQGLGQTKYIADLAFPGMLHARIKRAGIASARIKRFDVAAAAAIYRRVLDREPMMQEAMIDGGRSREVLAALSAIDGA